MALSKNHGTISVHDVGLFMQPVGTVTEEQLEQLTFDVERVLYDHAYGENFSAAVACSFDPPGIEIDLSICAVSGAIVNRRVSEILGAVEKHLSISLDLREQKVAAQDKSSAVLA